MAGKIEAFMELVDKQGLSGRSDLAPVKAGSAVHESVVAAYAEALYMQQDEGIALPDVVIGIEGRTNKVASDVAEKIGKGFVGFYSTGKSPEDLELTAPSAAYIESRASGEKLNVLIVDDVAVQGESVSKLVDEVKEIAPDANMRALFALGEVKHLQIAGVDIASIEEMAQTA
jgi:orotate phosphoribosyltransferase-like protein